MIVHFFCNFFSHAPKVHATQENKDLNENNLKILKEFVLKHLFPNSSWDALSAAQQQQCISILACLYLFFSLEPSNTSITPKGIRLIISTTFPIGAGLGSSAALSVNLATLALWHLQYYPYHDSPLNEKELDLINSWAFILEKIIHGTPSGIDNSVATFGKVLTMHRDLQTQKVHIGKIDKVPHQVLKILIVNTKVGRNTKLIVAGVRERRQQDQTLYDSIMDQVEKCSNECIDSLSKYEQHTMTKEELYSNLEQIISRNQSLLNQMGVGQEKLDRIQAIAKDFGLAAKLTGAGAGGCGYVLLRDSTSLETIAKLKQAMEAEGFECYETGIAGVGAKLEQQ